MGAAAGSIVGGVASALINVAGSSGASSAASEQSEKALDLQRMIYLNNMSNLAPWRNAGTSAINTLMSKIQAGPGDYTKSPGYAFRLNEGLKALNNSASARGKVLGGANTIALNKYAQDYATNDYQTFLQNYYQSMNPLLAVSGEGEAAAAQGVSASNQIAGLMTNTYQNLGNIQAAGYINNANALTGAIGGGINNYLMAQYLNGSGSNNALSVQPQTPVGSNYMYWAENAE